MKYKEFGDKINPTIILLHGGGLSWWSFTDLIHLLKEDFHIVTPIIDGHGEDGETPFISIKDSAQKLIQYIDEKHKGKVFAVCGLSLGAQIVVEILSQRADIAKYAVVESALVVPPTGVIRFMVKSGSLFYGLIRQRWFARIQAKALYVPESLFDQYHRDSQNISKESLINIFTRNTDYTAPDTLKNTKAKVLIIIDGEEVRIMDKSVRKLMSVLPHSRVCIVPGMKHGELSLARCKEYLALIKQFMV
ncbi:alpha/beta hydrolase [Dehalobacterium formicoaceticum]|uniref:Alpha/beta hydrolase n=1 Tax=Dehalobacterium formicoaceticum TaxID=51515 RepID=A0ABT1YAN1_9FIRM|nr:alpha/beta hydrolase [Dehalobacterium formicoaceticum]MCR6547150.1 alpha/beta hydrolase [Dehalobacterium formicoaceticum]